MLQYNCLSLIPTKINIYSPVNKYLFKLKKIKLSGLNVGDLFQVNTTAVVVAKGGSNSY